MDLLNNIIIGINELYVCKYLLDLDLTLMNIWRDNYCLENDYDRKMKLGIIFSMLHNNGTFDTRCATAYISIDFRLSVPTWLAVTSSNQLKPVGSSLVCMTNRQDQG